MKETGGTIGGSIHRAPDCAREYRCRATPAKEQQRLLLQGGEQGRLWSLVIGQRSGEMTASILDHDDGFLMSGTCTLP